MSICTGLETGREFGGTGSAVLCAVFVWCQLGHLVAHKAGGTGWSPPSSSQNKHTGSPINS